MARRETSHDRRQIQSRVNEGNNATLSEAVSSAEPPRRMKRNTSVMSSSSSDYDETEDTDDVSSSSSDYDETEATERCKFKKREKGRVP